MKRRRSSFLVDEDSLGTLRLEAERRRVSLAQLLREAIDEKVTRLRATRRPRVGVARSRDGGRAAELTGDPTADEFR